jgi:hypothetical protein
MLSKTAYGCCLLLVLYTSFVFHPIWQKSGTEATISWDVSGYYWYLPAVFIYKDLKKQKFADSIIAKYSPTPEIQQSSLLENGNRVNTYSSGMAFMYLPSFFLAHVLAEPLGYPADGFSRPYQFMVHMSSLLIAFIGLWWLRKLFLLYFSDAITAAILFINVFGTLYLNYTAIGGAMTHNWLFTIYVLLLLNTHYFYKTPNYKYAIRIGLLCGLAILIRPTEMISVLIPLLWGMESISAAVIRQKLNFLKQHFRKLLIASVCVVAVGFIQVAYWLYISGEPFVYSYRGEGQTFSWLAPHFYNYMLAYRSGWLVYTPLMVLCFIGIIPFLKTGKNRLAILAFFFLNLYIVSAWDTWWYAGTGGRAMIQGQPVLFFLIAAFLQFIASKKIWKWVFTPFILLSIYMNLWLTWNGHAAPGLFDSESMTQAYYWAVAGRWKVSEQTQKLKDTDELFKGKPKQMKLLYENGFETDTLYNATQPVITGEKSIFIRKHFTSPEYSFAYNGDEAEWVRAQATFHCIHKEWGTWDMTQFIVRFKHKGTRVKEKLIKPHRFLVDNEEKDIFIDVKIPAEPFDTVSIFFWSDACDQELIIDNLKVWSFKE